jgi:RNase P subunit RPR2
MMTTTALEPISVSTQEEALGKTCTKCQLSKPHSDYYVCRSRTDGLSSTCKSCSNATRRKYKKVKKTEYRLVARASSAKPTVCPDCGTTDVPSHKMRGRLDANSGEVIFTCFDCRSAELKGRKWCDWCCEAFVSPLANPFCSKPCLWAWFQAREVRVAREHAVAEVHKDIWENLAVVEPVSAPSVSALVAENTKPGDSFVVSVAPPSGSPVAVSAREQSLPTA